MAKIRYTEMLREKLQRHGKGDERPRGKELNSQKPVEKLMDTGGSASETLRST
jgi:hypothetical protein